MDIFVVNFRCLQNARFGKNENIQMSKDEKIISACPNMRKCIILKWQGGLYDKIADEIDVSLNESKKNEHVQVIYKRMQ